MYILWRSSNFLNFTVKNLVMFAKYIEFIYFSYSTIQGLKYAFKVESFKNKAQLFFKYINTL